MKKVPCKGCGRPIVFARNGEGKMIPLDPTPPVYAVAEIAEGTVQCTRLQTAMVSHFATCTNPGKFSGRSRRRDDARQETQPPSAD